MPNLYISSHGPSDNFFFPTRTYKILRIQGIPASGNKSIAQNYPTPVTPSFFENSCHILLHERSITMKETNQTHCKKPAMHRIFAQSNALSKSAPRAALKRSAPGIMSFIASFIVYKTTDCSAHQVFASCRAACDLSPWHLPPTC